MFLLSKPFNFFTFEILFLTLLYTEKELCQDFLKKNNIYIDPSAFAGYSILLKDEREADTWKGKNCPETRRASIRVWIEKQVFVPVFSLSEFILFYLDRRLDYGETGTDFHHIEKGA